MFKNKGRNDQVGLWCMLFHLVIKIILLMSPFPEDYSQLLSQDKREVLPPNPEVAAGSVVAFEVAHGIEVASEFKPLEHPTEPLDNDTPVECPLPEPSILDVRG